MQRIGMFVAQEIVECCAHALEECAQLTGLGGIGGRLDLPVLVARVCAARVTGPVPCGGTHGYARHVTLE